MAAAAAIVTTEWDIWSAGCLTEYSAGIFLPPSLSISPSLASFLPPSHSLSISLADISSLHPSIPSSPPHPIFLPPSLASLASLATPSASLKLTRPTHTPFLSFLASGRLPVHALPLVPRCCGGFQGPAACRFPVGLCSAEHSLTGSSPDPYTIIIRV